MLDVSLPALLLCQGITAVPCRPTQHLPPSSASVCALASPLGLKQTAEGPAHTALQHSRHNSCGIAAQVVFEAQQRIYQRAGQPSGSDI